MQRALLRTAAEQEQLTAGLLVGKDRAEVTVTEATRFSARSERPLDLRGAVQLGESTASAILRLTRCAP